MTYCQVCRADRPWRQVAVEQPPHPGLPAPITYRCAACPHTRVAYADVDDVAHLCLVVLTRAVRAGTIRSDADLENALGELVLVAWTLYSRWKPTPGSTFKGYAMTMLPRKLIDYQRGEVGRDTPKAHAHASSLDAVGLDPERHAAVDPADVSEADLAQLFARVA